jgi:hypothetical protein
MTGGNFGKDTGSSQWSKLTLCQTKMKLTKGSQLRERIIVTDHIPH